MTSTEKRCLAIEDIASLMYNKENSMPRRITRPTPDLLSIAVAVCLLVLFPSDSLNAYQVPKEIEYVVVPAGLFLMGQNSDTDAYMDEWPLHLANVPYEFAISKYEVTNAQYASFLNSVDRISDTNGNPYIDEDDPDLKIERVDSGWRAKPGWENKPMVEVSWYGADAYCRWLGGRLPTEKEWEKAARGVDGRIYPWGNQFLPPGENPRNPKHPRCSFLWGNRKLQSGNPNTCPVDSFSSYPSPYGIQDMAGNVWEWTTGGYCSYPGGPIVFVDTSREVTRGGSWTNSDYNLRCATRSPQPRYMTDANLGFRVVWSDYEPTEPAVFLKRKSSQSVWIEHFDREMPIAEVRRWWGTRAGFAFGVANSCMTLTQEAGFPNGGEHMVIIRCNSEDVFAPGDYVDITVRLCYDTADRSVSRCSVAVAWGDTRRIIPGARGADENTGYPWFLIANNSDSPNVWHEVTCERVRWGVGKLCIGFGTWGSYLDEHRGFAQHMWVDYIMIRHSEAD